MRGIQRPQRLSTQKNIAMGSNNSGNGNDSIVRGTAETSAGDIEVHVPAVVEGAGDRVDEIVVIAEMDDRQGAGGTFSAVVYNEDGNRTTDGQSDEPRSPEVSFSEDSTPEGFPEFEGVVLTTIGGRFAAANIGDEIAIEFNGDEILRAPRDDFQYVGGTGAEVLSRLFLPDRVGGGDEERVAELEDRVERQSEAIAELRAELSETQDEANVDVPDGGSSFGELGEAAGAFLDEIIDG